MDRRPEAPKSRGRITAPTRRSAANNDDSLTIDDIPKVLPKSGFTKESFHLGTPVAPSRRSTPPAASHTAPARTPDAKALAGQRVSLGFDDIPVASPGEIAREKARRERAGTWAKEAYAHSSSAVKGSRLGRFFAGKGISGWKEDLKWAIDADRGVDENSAKKPANVVADRPRQQAVDSTKTIDINISFGSLPKMPKIARLKNPLPGLPRFSWNRKMTKIALGAAAAVGVLAVLYSLPVTQQLLPSSKNEGPALSAASTPSYQTILPAGKTDITWQRVSPPDRDPVFAYSDMLENVKIAVSQQPIPDNFKPNVADSVANLAKSYAATDKVTAGDTQLYVGTSGQGPQSVIFTKNGLLVLIKSSGKIPDAAWARYVESLQNGPHY